MDNGAEVVGSIMIYLLIINIIGCALMWYDKKCAQRGQWRVKEKTLFTISLIGGSIGTFAGMYLFRHKTKHTSFKYGIPTIIVLQVCTLVLIKSKLYINLLQVLKQMF